MKGISGIVVVAFALFLLGLAVAIYARPAHAERFLTAFAGSARIHYAEQAVRLVVGGALVFFSSEMGPPTLFRLLGWLIVGTTIGLLCMPWTWHHRFATWVMPPVIQHLKLYGVGVAAFAVLLLYGVLTGNAV